ncbi:MAG TPA: SUMF1/EgtB/PvdO family nonheme iron enzyme [Ramlibacter sp.]|nr:SUMF1/EgtB/PvdO family nonheme iron enzyme [Ramlibacter sp.]
MPPESANDMRRAGRERLSLALMDARNHTLQLLAHFEGAQVPCEEATELPLWVAGHIAWLAEYWIGRNPQRALGSACPPDSMRLASIEPKADAWFNPALASHDARWQLDLPGVDNVRAFLLETLESTLELLEKTPDEDDALYFYRMALFHEELRREQLIAVAQALGVHLPIELPMGMQSRDALLVPATVWVLGAQPGGFMFDVEKWAHEVEVPEFEIDAQPVNWSQYIEFVDESGYDRQELWHPEGWAWLQKQAQGEGRRGPRHVEQIGSAGGAVRQFLFGRPTRMSGSQGVMHVSWWEADAYARWAKRRLPTEVEWEIAASTAGRQGFCWGDVREWTAGTLRPWAGFRADAWTANTDFEAEPNFGKARVQRGASFATPPRVRDAKMRRFALPHRDDAFVGFRTCSL